MSEPRELRRPSGKQLILIVCDYYLPGYESGGAMRTLVNMVERLSDSFDFRMITRDHDGPLNREPYKDVEINNWNRVGNADVYYISKEKVGLRHLQRLIADVGPDAIYLNSFFSPFTVSVLVLRKISLIRRIPIILAPEGEFSAGALNLKKVKKQLYISLATLLGLLDNITWKAAAESERNDINSVLGPDRKELVAPNMPPKMIFEDFDQSIKPDKHNNAATMVFLSRFMRKKNFNWLLPHLHSIEGELQIDICGPIEDPDYWNESQQMIETLPANITIRAKGPVPHYQVSKTLGRYHFFILPTLGENFGHVFIEALAAGCPLVISDRTPWRELEQQGIGWDLSLDDPSAWIEVLNKCIAMNNDEYRVASQKARQFAVDWLSDPKLESTNREVLLAAIDQHADKLGTS